jgi:hypothetical protein
MEAEFAREVVGRLPLVEAVLSLWRWVADPARAHGAEWRAPEHRSREAPRAACRSAAGRRSRHQPDRGPFAIWNEPEKSRLGCGG